jgi:hypothetical protein
LVIGRIENYNVDFDVAYISHILELLIHLIHACMPRLRFRDVKSMGSGFGASPQGMNVEARSSFLLADSLSPWASI